MLIVCCRAASSVSVNEISHRYTSYKVSMTPNLALKLTKYSERSSAYTEYDFGNRITPCLTPLDIYK